MDHVTLLVALGAFMGLAVIVVLARALSGTERKKEIPSPAGKYKDRAASSFSMGELAEIRLKKGESQSLEYALAFEKAYVADIAAHDAPEGLAELQGTLAVVVMYRRACEDATRGERGKDWSALLTELKRAAKERPSVPPVYELIDGAKAALTGGDFETLVTTIAGFQDRFPSAQSGGTDVVKLASDIVRVAAGYAVTMSGEKRADRRRASARMTEEVQRIAQEASKAVKRERLPELEQLADILSRAHQLARDEEVRFADKPMFEVIYQGDPEKLLIDNAYVNLDFAVENKAHRIQAIPRADVDVKALTTELRYEGDPREVVFEAGKAPITLSFHTFVIGDRIAVEPPELNFTVRYDMKGVSLSQEHRVKLPPIVAKKEIVNPFKEGRAGSALAGESKLFVGREKLLREMASGLLDRSPGSQPIYHMLVGLPRTGKSSVLNQLAENPAWHKNTIVPVKLRSFSESTTEELLYSGIYNEIKHALEDRLGLRVGREGANHKDRRDQIYDLLRRHEQAIAQSRKRLLFLVDEYQKLRDWDAAQDHTDPSGGFAGFIKILRDQYSHVLTVVMAGMYALEDKYFLGRPRWLQLLGGRVQTVRISNLDDDEADRLLERPFRDHGISVGAASLKRARGYTRGNPFLHALIGFYSFQRLLTGATYREGRTVELADIDAAALAVEGADMKFIWSEPEFEHLTTAQIFLAALAETSYDFRKEKGDPTDMPWCTIRDIERFLEHAYDVQATGFDFKGESGILMDRGIVEAGNNDRYRLAYPIFAPFCASKNQVGSLLALVKRNGA